MNIRNFSIVAHIDHGKSTLADRILEYTKTIPAFQMRPQVLDRMDLEREKGITIKSKTIRINYKTLSGENYILNLIDTPGHVDFSYEVSRALLACEGVLLLVDASQGVEAQTLANADLAKRYKLKIIPVINKIDLPTANIEETKKQLKNMLYIDEEPLCISAKNNIGTEEVLEAIVKKIPPPQNNIGAGLSAIVFDASYDTYRGVIIFVRIISSEIYPGLKVTFASTKAVYEITEVGYMQLKMIPTEKLTSGEVGYFTAGIKNMHEIKIGDIIVNSETTEIPIKWHYETPKPFVFADFYPVNPGEYDNLSLALQKLHLTDYSFQYSLTTSVALGQGFHCGFLGSLHLDIVRERVEREFGISILVTIPNVIYRIKTKNGSLEIDNAAKFPHWSNILATEEPYVKALIVTPIEYISSITELCKRHRGKFLQMQCLVPQRVSIFFELPLSEIIVGFYDALKAVSKGYASFDYEHIGYKESNLVKLEVLINGTTVDTFSVIVHKSKASDLAHKIANQLKEHIPRHLFKVTIQVKMANHIIAREDIQALRKDVLAKCYGGDVTRKRKLLEKQKEGKKKMKQFGNVRIPQEAFLSFLRMEQ